MDSKEDRLMTLPKQTNPHAWKLTLLQFGSVLKTLSLQNWSVYLNHLIFVQGMCTTIPRMHINNIDRNLAKATQWPHPLTWQDENFHWNSNFAISLIENSLNFNSACYKILKNFLMMAYINDIQKIKIC